MDILDSIYRELNGNIKTPKQFKTVKRQAILVDPITLQPLKVVENKQQSETPKSSPPSRVVVPKREKIKVGTPPKPQIVLLPKKPEECPEGKELNPKTGKCRNIPKKPKECAEGQIRHPETKRCRKIGTVSKEPKEPKEPKKPKKPKTPKECPEGKVRNPATGRCRNIVKSPITAAFNNALLKFKIQQEQRANQ